LLDLSGFESLVCPPETIRFVDSSRCITHLRLIRFGGFGICCRGIFTPLSNALPQGAYILAEEPYPF
jgi:hypothetical protein